MPDWTYSTTSGTDWDSDTAFYVTIPGSFPSTQQELEEYQREYERQLRIDKAQMWMLEKRMEKERQLVKDKIKYPLFFLKEGIV